jgi:ribosomal protein L32
VPILTKFVQPELFYHDDQTGRDVYLAYVNDDAESPQPLPIFSLQVPGTSGLDDSHYVAFDLRLTKSWQPLVKTASMMLADFLSSKEYWAVLFDGSVCPSCGSDHLANIFMSPDPDLELSHVVCHHCGIKWSPSMEYYREFMGLN